MVDDEFDAIVAGIEIEDPGTRTFPESNLHLMREFYALKNDLNARGVLLFPQTEEDKDLQARYFGLTQEMRRRRLM